MPTTHASPSCPLRVDSRFLEYHYETRDKKEHEGDNAIFLNFKIITKGEAKYCSESNLEPFESRISEGVLKRSLWELDNVS